MAADAAPGIGGEGASHPRARHDRPSPMRPLVACRALRGPGAACSPDRDRRTPQPALTPDRTRQPAHGAGRGAIRPTPSSCPHDGDTTPATRGRVGGSEGARTPPAAPPSMHETTAQPVRQPDRCRRPRLPLGLGPAGRAAMTQGQRCGRPPTARLRLRFFRGHARKQGCAAATQRWR
jgi:hypothetical protein